MKDEVGGVVGLIIASLDACSPDYRQVLLQNIVVSGVVSMIPGMLACCLGWLVYSYIC